MFVGDTNVLLYAVDRNAPEHEKCRLLIHILMREHGIKVIYPRDTDFNRFAFLDVIDPITESRRRS